MVGESPENKPSMLSILLHLLKCVQWLTKETQHSCSKSEATRGSGTIEVLLEVLSDSGPRNCAHSVHFLG
jgi:hypothetical protein